MISKEEALKALDSLDCARMDTLVDAKGARGVLEAFIEQQGESEPVATIIVHNGLGECRVQVGRLCPELPQGCTRSHPHENMSAECERKTVEARATFLAAQSGAVDDLPPMETLVKQRDGAIEESTNLRLDNAWLRRQIDLRNLHQRNDVWFWQGDGSDHIESMSNGMAVVIRADQLRELSRAQPDSLADHLRIEQTDKGRWVVCVENWFPDEESARTTCRKWKAAYSAAPPVKEMVNRFLGWKLPQDFAPDAGISFAPPANAEWWPIGTNLLTADQAQSMFRYIMESELAQSVPRQGQEISIDVSTSDHDAGNRIFATLTGETSGNTWLAEETNRNFGQAAQQAQPVSRDWPEDFSHENGNYQCRCCKCGNVFNGYKRRVVCKACAAPVSEQPAAQTAGVPEGWKPVLVPTKWTFGSNVFKDWCSQWFGPDSDDDCLMRAADALINHLPAAPQPVAEHIAQAKGGDK